MKRTFYSNGRKYELISIFFGYELRAVVVIKGRDCETGEVRFFKISKHNSDLHNQSLVKMINSLLEYGSPTQIESKEDIYNRLFSVIPTVMQIPLSNIVKETREIEIVQARQVLHFYAKNMTKDSLSNIGWKIGNKDHATVIHSCKQVEKMYNNPTYNGMTEVIKEIEQRLKVKILT